MARRLAYYMSPEDEEALLYGPPPPPAPPNLVSDLVTPRRTDGDYSGFHDPYQREEPTPEELAADAAHEESDGLEVFREEVGARANPFDETEEQGLGLGSYAKRLYLDRNLEKVREAPAAVDKKAASVSAEQKTTPDETDEEKGPAPMTVQMANNIIDDTNKPPRAYGSEAERMMGSPQKGQRSDMFGLDDEEGWATEQRRRVQAVREAYGEDSPASTHWEDELLRERGDDRLTDAQIRRRAAAIGFIGAAFNDDMEAGTRWASQQHAANRDFASARDKARERDTANARIPRELAEAITASVPAISPEAAAQLRNNSPIVNAFQNGMYSQGGRAEGQQIGLSKKKLDLIAETFKAETTDKRIKMLGVLQTIGGLEGQQMRAAMLSQMTPEQIADLGAGWMASALGVSRDKGAAALGGDRSELTPEQQRKADIVTPDIVGTLANPKVRDQVLSDRVKATVNAEQKRENAVEQSIALAQNDRKFATKWQTDWDNAAMPLKEAIRSWKAMSPQGKEAFVEWTKQTKDPGSVFTVATVADQFNKKFTYAPGDQVHASKVLAAINSHVKAQAGSAVTGSEWDRIAGRVGLATGTWAPFNDPSVVGAFLDDAAKLMTQDRQTYERTMGGWK